ncbi:hypothetical protein [Paenibacillus bouchesdurhonensis]|uniref:hypothetical protein n=1 Tax=Paenibacillus bouchesdurhonensis TaxID=1870990 RepID=UPI000DA5F587|nr:hypothetical protein [Paenibacillus bouchesdurhonensis]
MKISAKSYWVWTEKAEKENPQRSRAGEMIWPHYAKEAPKEWLEQGLIVDKSEYAAEGQVELFDLLEGV